MMTIMTLVISYLYVTVTLDKLKASYTDLMATYRKFDLN